MQNINNRKGPRVFVKVVMEYKDDHLVKMLLDYPKSEAYLYDYSTNLSEGGIFIKTNKPAVMGSTLSVKFTLPNTVNLIEAKGIVRWVINEEYAQTNNLIPGIGIEFIELKSQDKQLLKRFIEAVQ